MFSEVVDGRWKFFSGQNEVTGAIQNFNSLQNENSENFENQSYRELLKLSNKWFNLRFWDGVRNL
jgi:hypothetical protein